MATTSSRLWLMKFLRTGLAPRWGALVLLGAISLLAGCAASPGPAPVEDPIATETMATTSMTSPRKQSKELSVGIDPVHGGFNPHLLQDDTQFIQELAGLVLPSSFIGQTMNEDLLLKVEELDAAGNKIYESVQTSTAPAEPIQTASDTTVVTSAPTDEDEKPQVVRTVRYHIAPEAQWSDGTPITAADYQYLWTSIINNPGTVNPAGYRAITQIRSTGGGKVVEVDFSSRYANWRGLFNNLLPSHLLRSEDFITVLKSGFPASAGIFTMRDYDRNRGMITLNRNDRFWGKEPARVEILTFREIRSVAQGVELLENGQISFMDVNPQETSAQAFGLVPDTQTRVETDNYALEVIANVHLSQQLRKELRSVIDPKLMAQVAYGRRTDLEVVDKEDKPQVEGLKKLGRPVRIGVDPTDPVASMAATTLVNLLAAQDIDAAIINSDTHDLSRNQIPTGKVDAVVAINGVDVAENYACPKLSVLGSNRSGYCETESEEFLNSYFAGDKTREELQQWVTKLEQEEALRTVIANNVRLEVLGSGIDGPDENLSAWPQGLSSLNTWRIHE